MTTVKIDIPDQQAAALSVKAAAQGLTLESWFQKIAEEEVGRSETPETPSDTRRGSVVEEMRRLRARIKPDPEGWTTRDYVKFGRR